MSTFLATEANRYDEVLLSYGSKGDWVKYLDAATPRKVDSEIISAVSRGYLPCVLIVAVSSESTRWVY